MTFNRYLLNKTEYFTALLSPQNDCNENRLVDNIKLLLLFVLLEGSRASTALCVDVSSGVMI